MSISIDNTNLLCPLCDSSNVKEYLKLSDRFSEVGGFYSNKSGNATPLADSTQHTLNGNRDKDPQMRVYLIYECRDCTFIFLHPRPLESEMSAFYTSAGYDPFMEVEGSKSLSQTLYEFAKPIGLRWKANLMKKCSTQPGKLLDVGAGTGTFLKHMSVLGWDTVGIEKDADAAEYARQNLNQIVHVADFADVGNSIGIFDAITFWHSLEHIHRFKENIELARDSLTDDGLLFIALPNPDSLDAGIYKHNWVAWDIPRHLWHFKPKSISRLMRGFGLDIIRIAAMPLDPFYNSLQSEFLIRDNALLRYAFRLPFVSACSFFNGLLSAERGSSITYVVRKI